MPIPTFESSTKQTRGREKEDLLEDAFSTANGASRPQIDRDVLVISVGVGDKSLWGEERERGST